MSKFKIGDKVRITGNSNYSRNEIGDIGVIESVCIDRLFGDYEVFVEGKPNHSNVTLEEEIELIYSSEDPYRTVQALSEDNIIIDIPKGTSLLEGEFEANNGKTYKVTIKEVSKREY